MLSNSKAAWARLTVVSTFLSCLVAIYVPAHAQAIASRAVCNNYGPNITEPVGDRDGHRLQVAEGSCLVQGGPLDGMVLTEQTIWEFDKGAGVMLSSQGVYRKPGAMAAYANNSGTMTFQMADGRVAGWTATGKGRVSMAVGAAASIAGKSYSWTARPSGPRSYVIDVSFD